VSPDDLLGRDKVDLNLPGVAEVYSGKTVLVTGAGGSIGSELSRQLMDCAPSRVILFDHSEFALYSIEKELLDLSERRGIEIIPVLGSVTDAIRVENVFERMGVDIALHAAAYKHVPMVEMNEVAGLSNNVIGTRTVAEAALRHPLENDAVFHGSVWKCAGLLGLGYSAVSRSDQIWRPSDSHPP